ncbi:MAG: hypothetical protein KKD33_08315 [Verrucomicrobia bacterium]|nr:hypothetical protein [Verrucomicrobiota bacterium]
MLKQNWMESRDRFAAFWNGAALDRSPVIIDSVGSLRNPMYRGAGYDYTKYGEDVDRFCDDYLHVWEARAEMPDDTVPAICPQMGGAIEAAFFAGAIEWGTGVTSLIPHNPREVLPLLRDVFFDPANPYYRRVLDETQRLSASGAADAAEVEKIVGTIARMG